MNNWQWLTQYTYTRHFIVRVLVKAILLFITLNVVFALTNPVPLIGRLSIYNWLVPGRERLPYGESSAAYNLSLNSLDAMFSSHEVARRKAKDEYRVLIMGDSSVWGVLLHNDETLSGNLNRQRLVLGGKRVIAYNLGHPIMSATKDLILMDYALKYDPNLIIWMVTLESLPYPKQLEAPIVQQNAPAVRALIDRFGMKLDLNDPRLVNPSFVDRTIVGERRALADWWRLQLFGINWALTNKVDQIYSSYEPRSNDFGTDVTWHGINPEDGIKNDDIAIDVLNAGKQLAGNIPLLIINEPIYVADGRNSNLRYNFWYPKWAYDTYRTLMRNAAQTYAWQYIDFWQEIAKNEFTDSPVHLTAKGSLQLSELIGKAIISAVQN